MPVGSALGVLHLVDGSVISLATDGFVSREDVVSLGLRFASGDPGQEHPRAIPVPPAEGSIPPVGSAAASALLLSLLTNGSGPPNAQTVSAACASDPSAMATALQSEILFAGVPGDPKTVVFAWGPAVSIGSARALAHCLAGKAVRPRVDRSARHAAEICHATRLALRGEHPSWALSAEDTHSAPVSSPPGSLGWVGSVHRPGEETFTTASGQVFQRYLSPPLPEGASLGSTSQTPIPLSMTPHSASVGQRPAMAKGGKRPQHPGAVDEALAWYASISRASSGPIAKRNASSLAGSLPINSPAAFPDARGDPISPSGLSFLRPPARVSRDILLERSERNKSQDGDAPTTTAAAVAGNSSAVSPADPQIDPFSSWNSSRNRDSPVTGPGDAFRSEGTKFDPFGEEAGLDKDAAAPFDPFGVSGQSSSAGMPGNPFGDSAAGGTDTNSNADGNDDGFDPFGAGIDPPPFDPFGTEVKGDAAGDPIPQGNDDAPSENTGAVSFDPFGAGGGGEEGAPPTDPFGSAQAAAENENAGAKPDTVAAEPSFDPFGTGDAAIAATTTEKPTDASFDPFAAFGGGTEQAATDTTQSKTANAAGDDAMFDPFAIGGGGGGTISANVDPPAAADTTGAVDLFALATSPSETDGEPVTEVVETPPVVPSSSSTETSDPFATGGDTVDLFALAQQPDADAADAADPAVAPTPTADVVPVAVPVVATVAGDDTSKEPQPKDTSIADAFPTVTEAAGNENDSVPDSITTGTTSIQPPRAAELAESPSKPLPATPPISNKASPMGNAMFDALAPMRQAIAEGLVPKLRPSSEAPTDQQQEQEQQQEQQEQYQDGGVVPSTAGSQEPVAPVTASIAEPIITAEPTETDPATHAAPNPCATPAVIPITVEARLVETLDMRVVGRTTSAYAITGELSLRADSAMDTIDPSSDETVTIRLQCPPGRLGKVVHNSQVAEPISGDGGHTYAVRLSSLVNNNNNAEGENVAVVALRYRLADHFRPIPLKVVPSWAVAPSVTNLAVSYCAHPLLTEPLLDCSFVVPVTTEAPAGSGDDNGTAGNTPGKAAAGASIGRMQLKPVGLWSATQAKLLWKVPRVDAGGGPAKLLAKFETLGGVGCPAPVAVKFRCEGVNLSGARVEMVARDAGGDAGGDGTHRFAASSPVVTLAEHRGFAAGKITIHPPEPDTPDPGPGVDAD